MEEGVMAELIGKRLDESGDGWIAVGYDIGEVHLSNGFGDKFVLTVAKVDVSPGEDD